MNVYTTQLPNQARCLLIDNFLPDSHLSDLHAICDKFDKNSSEWQHPDWTQYRYHYCGNTDSWQRLVEYLSTPQDELTKALGYTVVCAEAVIWAEFQGLGPLAPHVENVDPGKHLSQLYISKISIPNIGTTIYTDEKEILFLLPFRDNFSWFFDESGKVMHGRVHDVPENLTRFTMMMHWVRV